MFERHAYVKTAGGNRFVASVVPQKTGQRPQGFLYLKVAKDFIQTRDFALMEGRLPPKIIALVVDGVLTWGDRNLAHETVNHAATGESLPRWMARLLHAEILAALKKNPHSLNADWTIVPVHGGTKRKCEKKDYFGAPGRLSKALYI